MGLRVEIGYFLKHLVGNLGLGASIIIQRPLYSRATYVPNASQAPGNVSGASSSRQVSYQGESMALSSGKWPGQGAD